MSKIRQDVPSVDDDQPLDAPPEGDLRPWVVFTQLKKDGPFIYAGWLDAADREMALDFAREHYGQDQQCCAIWCVPREALGGTDGPVTPATGASASGGRTWRVFRRDGDVHASAGTVEAATVEEAIESAGRSREGDDESTWVAPLDAIAATTADDLIWRHTDQSYRLARGYSKTVREKWEKVRARPELERYEREDLEQAF